LIDNLQDELIHYGIGNTIFHHSCNIEKLLIYNNIYIKFEGGNPTGTMKDRAAYNCLKEAKLKGYKEIAIGSCGNFGAAFVHLAQFFKIKTNVYIPEHYHTKRIVEMEQKGAIIHRAPGTYEDVVAYSSREALRNGWYDANPGVNSNTKLSIEAYAAMSYEIYNQLCFAPDAVAVPVGNGTTIAGIYYGFKQLYKAGKTKKIPVMIAASTTGGNPVIKCFKAGEKMISDLKPEDIIETDYNEPLVSWISLDGQEALDALWESNGWATYVEDSEMLTMSNNLLKEEGLSVLPASSASLLALKKYVVEKRLGKGLDLIAILTARQP